VKKNIKTFALVAYTAFCSMLMFGMNASAYLDPSVMTYAIQIVAGLAVALGAVVSVYWRKAKKLISQKFGIDENRNKEYESDEIIVYGEE